MICLDCQHARMKAEPKFAVLGMVPCAVSTRQAWFVSLSFERKCDDFILAAEATRKVRHTWFATLKFLSA